MVSDARRMPTTALGRKMLATATTEEMRQLLLLGNTPRYNKVWNDMHALSPTANGLNNSQSGTSAGISQAWEFINTSTNAIGCQRIDMGTDANSWASLHQYNNVVNIGDDIEITLESRIGFEALSTVTVEYYFNFGFGNAWNNNTAPSNSITFRYDRATYGNDNWHAVVRKSNVETATDLGVAVVVGLTSAMQVLLIEINADGSEVLFSIDGTLQHTETGVNIPTARVSQGWQVIKTVDATGADEFIGVDWFAFETLQAVDRA